MVMTKSIEVLPGFQLETLPPSGKKYPMTLQFVRSGFGVMGRFLPDLTAKLAYNLFATPRLRAVHKVSDEILESARIFEILYEKHILKCYEWGKGERTIVLVHGWESRGTALRSFVPGLVDAGFRVVAFDGPAHGDSGGKRTNLVHFAGAVKAVLKQSGNIRGIITHSFGGATTVHALAHLDNSIEVEKLVMIAMPASTRRVFHDFYKLVNLPKPTIKAFQSMVKKRFKLPLEEADILHSLGKTGVEDVLVVHDKFDEAVPFESAEEIYEKWGHVSMLVTQGHGHFKLMKRPEVIERVVEFIVD